MSKAQATPSSPLIIRSKYLTQQSHKSITPLNYDPESSRTKQSFQEECDINNILKRYSMNDILNSMSTAPELYSDFSEVPDFHAAQEIIAKANQQFAALPANIRNAFQNDPAEFLKFAQTEGNAKALIELGLASPRPNAAKTIDDLVESIEKRLPLSQEPPEPKTAPKGE